MRKITIDLESYGDNFSIGYDMSNGVEESVVSLVKHIDDNTQLLAFIKCITGEPLQPWHERILFSHRRLGIRDNFKLKNYNSVDINAVEDFKTRAMNLGTSIHEAILTADHYPTGFIQLSQAGSQVASAFPAMSYGLNNSEPTEFEGGFRKSFVHKSVIHALGVKE
jgi:hypothetical protein